MLYIIRQYRSVLFCLLLRQFGLRVGVHVAGSLWERHVGPVISGACPMVLRTARSRCACGGRVECCAVYFGRMLMASMHAESESIYNNEVRLLK